MKQFKEKLITRLEEEKKEAQRDGSFSFAMGFKVAISIVNELAEEMGVAKNAITNADRIRNMTDEELAEWLTKITDDAQLDSRTKCNYQWDEWLQSKADAKGE